MRHYDVLLFLWAVHLLWIYHLRVFSPVSWRWDGSWRQSAWKNRTRRCWARPGTGLDPSSSHRWWWPTARIGGETTGSQGSARTPWETIWRTSGCGGIWQWAGRRRRPGRCSRLGGTPRRPRLTGAQPAWPNPIRSCRWGWSARTATGRSARPIVTGWVAANRG